MVTAPSWDLARCDDLALAYRRGMPTCDSSSIAIPTARVNLLSTSFIGRFGSGQLKGPDQPWQFVVVLAVRLVWDENSLSGLPPFDQINQEGSEMLDNAFKEGLQSSPLIGVQYGKSYVSSV
jgi:hypothetical protein